MTLPQSLISFPSVIDLQIQREAGGATNHPQPSLFVSDTWDHDKTAVARDKGRAYIKQCLVEDQGMSTSPFALQH